MPFNRPAVSRTLKLVLGLAGVCLLWYTASHRVPDAVALLIALGLPALIWVLIRTGALPIPAGTNVGPFGQPVRVRDILRFVACMAAGLGWVALAAGRVPDTTAGAVIIFAPSLLLIAIGMFFLGRVLIWPFFSRPKT